MKKYVVYDNGSYHVIGPDSHPPTIYAEFYDAPEGVSNDDGDIIKVINGVVTIDQIKKAAKDAAKQAQLNAEVLVAYKSKRKAEYPSTGDQLDAIYKKLHLNDSTDWDLVAGQIEAVKLKYPKPE